MKLIIVELLYFPLFSYFLGNYRKGQPTKTQK
jgi:hypothetical protein